jgi:hypothetical protein
LLLVGLALLPACWTASAAAAPSAGATPAGASGSLARPGSPDPLALAAAQQAELTAPNGSADDEFGYSTAVSGDTVVVGAPWHSVDGNLYEGAAYVFVCSGGVWSLQATLTASDGASWDWFGWAVAIEGDTALIAGRDHNFGAGAVYVFDRSGDEWTQEQTLTASDAGQGDQFGDSVALDGDTALVGASQHTVGSNYDQGAAYVFTLSGTSWAQQAELIASDGTEDAGFGSSVALSGDTALIGSPNPGGEGDGAAYVFVSSGAGWTQQTELVPEAGGDMDFFGKSVALDGDTALVGAPWQMSSGPSTTQGLVYVFTRSGPSWSRQAELTADDEASDEFGWSVALDGDNALIGSPEHQVGANDGQGTAYLFTGSGSSWSQQSELSASDGAASDAFGSAVALDGGLLLVGAPDHAVSGKAEQGAAYVAALPPTSSSAPVVSGDTAPGGTLSCSPGVWSHPSPILSYQWLRDGVPIDDAIAATYVVRDADCTHDLSCTVTATNAAGSASATSNEVSIPAAAPANTAAPVVSGQAGLSDTLSCTSGSWTGIPTPACTYQWLRDGVAIADATDDTYTIAAADLGHLLACLVTATNTGGALGEISNGIAVPAVLGAPTSAQAPALSGTATLGQVLDCSSGGWTGTVASLAYQWLRDGVAIAGATRDAHQVTVADCGTTLSCVVTATNTAGQTSVASDGLTAAAAPAVGLQVSRRSVVTGKTIVIGGAVTNPLAAARIVCICRRLHGRLVVLHRLTLSGAGAFRWTWHARRGGLWRFVAVYTAAGHRFASPAVSVTVRKQ